MTSTVRMLTRFLAAALVAALAGCAPRTARERVERPSVVTLTFFNYATPEFLALYEGKLIPAFERTHPNIRVRTITDLGNTNYDAKLLTLIAGKIPPDLFHVTQQNFPSYAVKDVLLPLDDLIRHDPTFHISDYYPNVVSGLQYRGQTLGLPSDFSTIVMLYNQDLFDRFHVPYPKPDWTWDDFLRTAKALTHDTDGDGHTDVFGFYNNSSYNRWPAWVWMNGGDILTHDGTRCIMDTPQAIGGMRFYTDLSLSQNVAPKPGQNLGQGDEDMFASQMVAMLADSRFVYKKYLKGKGLPFRWDLAPMPRGKTRATTFIWGGNCILKSTKHPKEAWEFLKFLSGKEGAEINVQAGNALPAYRPVAEATIAHPTHPKTPAHDRYFLDAIAYGRQAPFPAQFAEFNAASNNLQDAFLGLRPVDAACRDFTREVNGSLSGKVF